MTLRKYNNAKMTKTNTHVVSFNEVMNLTKIFHHKGSYSIIRTKSYNSIWRESSNTQLKIQKLKSDKTQ